MAAITEGVAQNPNVSMTRGGVQPDPNTLVVVVLQLMFTMSTGDIFGIPRVFVSSVIFTGYMFFQLNKKFDKRSVQFALAYLAAFVPGTLLAAAEGNVKFVSVVQLAVSLMNFVVLVTYFSDWLLNETDDNKIRDLERVLIFYFVFSIVELMFFKWFESIRLAFYHTQFTDANGSGMVSRELNQYGGRPTGLFSEASNFARFMGIMVATYMAVTRCSLRSLGAFAVFLFLTRSVSYLFAAPVMALALWQFPTHLPFVKNVVGKRSGPNIWIILAIGIVIVVGIITTQATRIMASLTGGDGSFNVRILYPALYLFTQVKTPSVGMGVTPQDDMQSFIQLMEGFLNGKVYLPGFSEGMAPTLVIFAGIGIFGFVIFAAGMYYFQRRAGLLWLAIFLASNLLSAGYNMASLFVPAALLMSLLMYQRRLAEMRPGEPSRARRLPVRKPAPQVLNPGI